VLNRYVPDGGSDSASTLTITVRGIATKPRYSDGSLQPPENARCDQIGGSRLA
jgi:hypothetical protein